MFICNSLQGYRVAVFSNPLSFFWQLLRLCRYLVWLLPVTEEIDWIRSCGAAYLPYRPLIGFIVPCTSLFVGRVGWGIISVWFTHEITISWHALACIYKIVEFHFVEPNRYDTACSKLLCCEHSLLKGGGRVCVHFSAIKLVVSSCI